MAYLPGMHALRFSSSYRRTLAFRQRANELLPDYAAQIDAEAARLFGVTETEVDEHGYKMKRANQPDFTERLAKRIKARVEALEFVFKGKPLTISLPTKFASDGELDSRVGACVAACRKAGVEVPHTFVVNGAHVAFGPYKLLRGVFIPPSLDDGTPMLRVSVDEQLLLRGGPFRAFVQEGGLRLAFMGNAIKPWKIMLHILREIGPRNPTKRSEVLRRLSGKANLKYVRTGGRNGDVSVTVPTVKFGAGEKAVVEAKMQSLIARQDRLTRTLTAWDADGVALANAFATSPSVVTEQVR